MDWVMLINDRIMLKLAFAFETRTVETRVIL